MADTYICYVCKEECNFVRDDRWNEDKAAEEYKEKFGHELDKSKADIVCDDCWNKLQKVGVIPK